LLAVVLARGTSGDDERTCGQRIPLGDRKADRRIVARPNYLRNWLPAESNRRIGGLNPVNVIHHRAQRSQRMLCWYSLLGRHITEHRILLLIISAHLFSKVEVPTLYRLFNFLGDSKIEFFNKLLEDSTNGLCPVLCPL
jgi:hypothetical protein